MTNAAPIPTILYGTAWKEERTEALVELALSAGFRGIDTANQRKHYYEAGVGRALTRAFEAGLQRSQLFLQTKFTFSAGQDQRLPYDPNASIATQVEQSLRSSFEHLGVDYLDAYVLHGPSQRSGLGSADWEAWRSFERFVAAGQVRALGISNVSLQQLASLCDGANVPPAFVQNRCYASQGWDRELRAFCRERGIVYQGFSLLTANSRELSAPAVVGPARRLGCSPAAVVFRFATAVGMLPLTGTSNVEHMRLDLASNQLELRSDELQAIERVSSRT